jgi:hypothetical protein
VPDANKKDGELNGNGMLWDVGVVVEYVVVFNELYEAVENKWGDP